MKVISGFLFLLILGTLSLSSCGEKADVEIPEIVSLTPLQGDTAYSAGGLQISAYVKDDKELSQLKVEISPLYDTTEYSALTDKVFLAETRIYELSGQDAVAAHTIALPENVAAFPYVLKLTAVDASGNLSPVVSRTILIRNSADLSVPEATIATPQNGVVFPVGSDVEFHIPSFDSLGLLFYRYTLMRGDFVMEDYVSPAVQDDSVVFIGVVYCYIFGDYTLKTEIFDSYLNSTKTEVSFTVE